MRLRKIDTVRSLRRPTFEEGGLEALDTGLKGEFEHFERLLGEGNWTGTTGEGSIEQSVVRGADLSDTVLSSLELVDVLIERSVLSNGRWQEVLARRVELLNCQLVGWQAHFEFVHDFYAADSRADYAGISITASRGLVVFERCRFVQTQFAGDLSKTVFIDCEMRGVDFTRVSNARGCDLRSTPLTEVKGLMSLRGSLITAEQALQMAGELATEAGFIVS